MYNIIKPSFTKLRDLEQHSVLASDRLRDLKEDMINLNEKVDNLTEKIIKDRLGLLDGSRNDDMIKIEHGLDQVKYLLQHKGLPPTSDQKFTIQNRQASDKGGGGEKPAQRERYISPQRAARSNSRKRSSDKSRDKSSRGSSSCHRASASGSNNGARDSHTRDRSYSRSTNHSQSLK